MGLFPLACLFVNHVVGLRAAVAIPSVSADEERRPDVFKVCFVCQLLIR